MRSPRPPRHRRRARVRRSPPSAVSSSSARWTPRRRPRRHHGRPTTEQGARPMAEMIATTLALGDPAPAFALRDTTGAEHAVPAEDAPPATVLVVTCNHCPYVIAWNPRLRQVAEDYQPRDVRFLAINAN